MAVTGRLARIAAVVVVALSLPLGMAGTAASSPAAAGEPTQADCGGELASWDDSDMPTHESVVYRWETKLPHANRTFRARFSEGSLYLTTFDGEGQTEDEGAYGEDALTGTKGSRGLTVKAGDEDVIFTKPKCDAVGRVISASVAAYFGDTDEVTASRSETES